MPREQPHLCLLTGSDLAPQYFADRMCVTKSHIFTSKISNVSYWVTKSCLFTSLPSSVCCFSGIFPYLLIFISPPTTLVYGIYLCLFLYIIKTLHVSSSSLLRVILSSFFFFAQSSFLGYSYSLLVLPLNPHVSPKSLQSSLPQPSTQLIAAAPVGQGCYLSWCSLLMRLAAWETRCSTSPNNRLLQEVIKLKFLQFFLFYCLISRLLLARIVLRGYCSHLFLFFKVTDSSCLASPSLFLDIHTSHPVG